MDVRCEKCGTEYELDDARVTEQGVTVKCTQCGHIFRVVRKSQTAPKGVAVAGAVGQASGPAAAASGQKSAAVGAPGAAKQQVQPAAKQWFIRKASGETFRFRELTTLQQWIVEEKVGKEDEISRTGRSWEKLGAIEELKPFFMVVEQARFARKAALRPTEPDAAVMDENVFAGEEDMPTGQVAAGGKGSGRFEFGQMPKMGNQGPVELGDAGSVARASEPRWGDTGMSSAQPDNTPTYDEGEEDYFERRRRSKSRLVLMVGGLVLILGLGVAAAWNWDKLAGLVTSSSKPVQKDVLAPSRDLLRQDDFASLDRAFAMLDRLYRDKHLPDARGLQAESLAIKAMYLRFQGRDFDRRANELSEELLRLRAGIDQASKDGKAKASSPGDRQAAARVEKLQTQIKSLHERASGLRKEADVLADRSLAYAREALSAASTTVTQRAMAEALLAKGGEGQEALVHLNKAMALGPEDPDNYAARAMFEMARKQWQTARATIEAALDLAGKAGTTYYRGSYLLARILIAQGKRKDAAERLAAILAANSSHEAARALKAELQQAEPKRAERPVMASRTTGPRSVPTEPARPTTSSQSASGSGHGESGDDDYDSLVRKADRYSENGRVGDAKRLYERALKLRSGGVEALTGLAYCYLDRGRRSRAVRMFRRALGNSPSFGDALIGLAETYKNMGRLSQALKYYQRYLDSHPGGSKSGLARRNIEEIKDKLGQDRGARTSPEVVVPGTSGSGSGAAGSNGGSAGSTPRNAPEPGQPPRPHGNAAEQGGVQQGAEAGARPAPAARPSAPAQGGSSGGSSGSSGSSDTSARPVPRKPADSGSSAAREAGASAPRPVP